MPVKKRAILIPFGREKLISRYVHQFTRDGNVTSRRILEKAAITAGQAYALGQGLG